MKMRERVSSWSTSAWRTLAFSRSWRVARTLVVASAANKGQQRHGSLGSMSVEEVLTGLVRFLNLRDTETVLHCNRVSGNAVEVGVSLGFHKDQLEVLYWAGLLHDIGKVSIPRATLSKRGRLSESELDEIRRHPEIGAELLESLAPNLRGIADAVRYHHERWDGQGYPAGLRNRETPQSARVLAVVDVLEALTSIRPYREPLRVDQAMRYVRSCAGTHFDPEIVSVVESLERKGKLVFANTDLGEREPIDLGSGSATQNLEKSVLPLG